MTAVMIVTAVRGRLFPLLVVFFRPFSIHPTEVESTKESGVKLIYIAMFSVVSLALSSTGAGAQTWPTKPLRAVVPVELAARQTLFRAWCSNNSPHNWAGAASSRTERCWRDDRCWLRCQVGSRWLHDARPRVRAHDPACGVFESELSPGARFRGRYPPRHFAERAGRSTRKGLENRRRLRRRSQSKARCFELLVGRCRHRNPSECRTLPLQRGRERRYAVQGRRGSDDRSNRRTDRLLLRADRVGPAAYS